MKKHLFLFMNFISGLACAGLDNFYFEMQPKGAEKNLFVRARPANGDDLAYFKATYADEKAMSQYMNGGVRPEEEIKKRLQLAHDRTKAENPWNVWLYFASESKADLEQETLDRFWGLTRYEPSDRANKGDELEISYVLPPQHWRKGVGTKFIAEFLKQAYEWRKDKKIDAEDGKLYFVNSVYATARPDNPGSCGVLEKNSFKVEYENEKFGVVRRFYWLPFTPVIEQSSETSVDQSEIQIQIPKKLSENSTSAEGSQKADFLPQEGGDMTKSLANDPFDGDSSGEENEKDVKNDGKDVKKEEMTSGGKE